MDHDKKKQNTGAEWKLIDFVIPTLAFALAAYYLYSLRELPSVAQYYGGTISVLIGVCFVAFVIAFFKNKVYLQFKTLFSTFKKGATTDKETGKTITAILLLAFTLLYVWAIKLIGYTAATFLYLCVIMPFLGRRGIWGILLPALLVTVIGFILFIVILNLNIALDPLSRSLKYLIRGWIF